MAASRAPRLLLVLRLFSVLIVIAVSRHRIDAFDLDGIPDDSSQNVSTSPNMKPSPDYMMRLLHRVTNPDGEQVKAGAVWGNLIYGFTENG